MKKEKYTSPAEDLRAVNFGDKRLNERLVRSTEERTNARVRTRASAKGFYRLLSNDKFGNVANMLISLFRPFVYADLQRHINTFETRPIFEEDEWKMLYRFVKRTRVPPKVPYSMAEAVKMLGELGLGKRAPSDGIYGVKAIWLGLKSFYSALDLLVSQV